jgi:hypothetical protein
MTPTHWRTPSSRILILTTPPRVIFQANFFCTYAAANPLVAEQEKYHQHRIFVRIKPKPSDHYITGDAVHGVSQLGGYTRGTLAASRWCSLGLRLIRNKQRAQYLKGYTRTAVFSRRVFTRPKASLQPGSRIPKPIPPLARICATESSPGTRGGLASRYWKHLPSSGPIRHHVECGDVSHTPRCPRCPLGI